MTCMFFDDLFFDACIEHSCCCCHTERGVCESTRYTSSHHECVHNFCYCVDTERAILVPCVGSDPTRRKLILVQRVAFRVRQQQGHIFVVQEDNVATGVAVTKSFHNLWLPLSGRQPPLIALALQVFAVLKKFCAIRPTLYSYLGVIRRTSERPLLLPPLRANVRPTRYITVSRNCLGESLPNIPCDQSSSSFSTVIGSNFFSTPT